MTLLCRVKCLHVDGLVLLPDQAEQLARGDPLQAAFDVPERFAFRQPAVDLHHTQLVLEVAQSLCTARVTS
jgi:hypothetical protein